MERLEEFIAWSGMSKTKCLEEEKRSGVQRANEISVTKQEWVIVHQNNEKGLQNISELFGEKSDPARGRFFSG